LQAPGVRVLPNLILKDLAIERVTRAGMSTERCVTQTAIDAREAGLKVSGCGRMLIASTR
jgi:hypothetical protein